MKQINKANKIISFIRKIFLRIIFVVNTVKYWIIDSSKWTGVKNLFCRFQCNICVPRVVRRVPLGAHIPHVVNHSTSVVFPFIFKIIRGLTNFFIMILIREVVLLRDATPPLVPVSWKEEEEREISRIGSTSYG